MLGKVFLFNKIYLKKRPCSIECKISLLLKIYKCYLYKKYLISILNIDSCVVIVCLFISVQICTIDEEKGFDILIFIYIFLMM